MGNEIGKKYDVPNTHNATAGHCQLWKIYPCTRKDPLNREDVSIWICQKEDLAKRTPNPITDKSIQEQIFQILRKDVACCKDLSHNGTIRVHEV